MAQNVEEMVVKWSLDNTNFNNGVTAINRSMNVLKSEFKATDTNLKNFGNTTDQLKNKQEYLNKTMELQAKKVETLKSAYEKSRKETGENSNATENLAIKVNNATSYYSNLEKQLQDVNNQLASYNDTTETSNSKTTVVGTTMTVLGDGAQALGQKIQNVTNKIKELGQSAITNYKEVKSGTDEVIKATGATGEAADDLKESFKDIASNSTADFKLIGTTLGEINTRFGFTGDAAEDCTNKFIAFAKITNSDATEAVKNVSRYMGDASINSNEYSKVLDNLAKASQASGISVSNLTENLTKYGAPMRALGFETEQTIALFSSWEKAGVNTEIAFSGMKKAISNWSAAGKDSRVEFQKTLNEIKACPDIASATTKAIEVFGTKAGPDLADAIKGGRFEYTEMVNQIQNSKDTVSNTLGEMSDGSAEYTKAQNAMKVASAEFGAEITSTVAPMLKNTSEKVKDLSYWFRNLDDGTKNTVVTIGLIATAIGPALVVLGVMASSIGKLVTLYGLFKSSLLATRLGVIGLTVAEKAKMVVDKAAAIAQGALNAIMAMNPVTLIIIGITALVALLVVLYKKCEPFRNFINQIWQSIKSTFSQIGTFLKGVFSTVWETVKSVFTQIVNHIKSIISTITQIVKTAINVIKVVIMVIVEVVKTVVTLITMPWRFLWENCKKYVFAAFNAIKTFILSYVEWWKSNWEAFKTVVFNIWNTIKDNIISVWETIKGAIQTAVDFIKNNIITPLKDFFSSVWESIKGAIQTAVDFIKNNIITPLKDFFFSVLESIKGVVETLWNSLKRGIEIVAEYIKTVWSSVTGVFSSVCDTISGVWNSFTGTISSVWDSIVSGVISAWDSIKAPFSAVVDGIKSVWEGIKSIFKLPHFSIEGSFSLDPPSIPHLNVEWYANGGILTQPTIFGMNGKNAMVGGEAGAEAVLPLSTLWDNLDKLLDSKINQKNNQPIYFTVQNVMDSKVIGEATYEIVDNKFAMNARGDR